jgi:hypothetical protein
MPCDSMSGWTPGHGAAEDARRLKQELDGVTALLCAMCRQMETNGQPITDPTLKAWWREHKAYDKTHGR